MLSELYIENLAVIEKTTVRFAQGLTVLSGETGAGKSILIDAINLVLGQRSNRDLVRTGAEKALVCAVFEPISAGVEQLLEQYGYEGENGQLLIQREISADGPFFRPDYGSSRHFVGVTGNRQPAGFHPRPAR